MIDEIATAVWAAQMNTVTFHPWPSRAADIDLPWEELSKVDDLKAFL